MAETTSSEAIITMHHIVITIIKWTFLATGLAMLAGASIASGGGALVLFIFGLVFAAIGGGIIGYGWWSSKNEASLRQHGQLVQAALQQVEINEALDVNGNNPFRIVAQWHDVKSNELFIFKSANLWFDPSDYVQGREIPVYMDPKKPSRYFVDLSFLPNVRN
jgi:hypothetical protein